MRFTVYYRSTRPVCRAEAAAIEIDADAATDKMTWLGCEPVAFFEGQDGGELVGGSKPNFRPHPDDIADAARQGLPDGTIRDVIDILCRLSRDHGIDWQIDHDYSAGPIGSIRAGVCDDEVLAEIDTFSDMMDVLGEEDINLDDE